MAVVHARCHRLSRAANAAKRYEHDRCPSASRAFYRRRKRRRESSSLTRLGLDGKTLIVDSLDDDNLLLSARNLRHTKVVNSFGLNIYDLLYHDRLILSRAAATELEQLLGDNKEAA